MAAERTRFRRNRVLDLSPSGTRRVAARRGTVGIGSVVCATSRPTLRNLLFDCRRSRHPALRQAVTALRRYGTQHGTRNETFWFSDSSTSIEYYAQSVLLSSKGGQWCAF